MNFRSIVVLVQAKSSDIADYCRGGLICHDLVALNWWHISYRKIPTERFRQIAGHVFINAIQKTSQYVSISPCVVL